MQHYMNNDLEVGPSFLEMGDSLIEAELTQTIVSETVSLESFQTVLSDKTKVNSMLELAEKSILYFVPKNSKEINYIWGLNKTQFSMVETRLKEVFRRSYNEFVPVFSFLSISVNTTAELTHLLADKIEAKPSLFKKKNLDKSNALRFQANHLDRLALVLRGLYLNHAKLSQEDWIKVEDDLKYIKSADTYIRENKKEFIEKKSNNITHEGLVWLNRQLKKKYERKYHHFNDDFPLIAEAWTMGVVTAKQSEHLTIIKKLPRPIQQMVKRYAQLSNTLMGLHKIEVESRLYIKE